MEPEKIIAIVIPCIMIIGTVVFHIIDFFEKNNPVYNIPTEQWDDIIKQKNEELRKAMEQTSCTSEQFEEGLNQMRTCTAKPTVKEVVGTMSDKQDEIFTKEVMDYLVNPSISFEAIMTSNEIRKMLGLDEMDRWIEEHETTIKDFTVKRVYPYDDRATITDEVVEEEPKSKKLEPLICKMCGGTVAKNGDNYECEYCGLKYEWR